MKRITNWLETHACVPAYGGWVLAGISICFLGAGINTMAGWLYVISGVSFALLSVAAVLPSRSLLGLVVNRLPIQPVTAGDDLAVEVEIINQAKQSVSLLQAEDILPFVLGKPVKKSIETIPTGSSYRWIYYHPAKKRGVYRWHKLELGTGAPLGLFWCRRLHSAAATAIVYPLVLPLASCPLVDQMGRQDSLKSNPLGKPLQLASVGLTRSLRPYRTGDPLRLIHWRTSARYGELRVRDLELSISGQDLIIALDSAASWDETNFEQAAIAAASLYFYAHRASIQVQLWTASTGLVKGDRVVKETLAATTPLEEATNTRPGYPLIWLTQNPLTLSSLLNGSRWLLWQNISLPQEQVIINKNYPGIVLDSQQPLQLQLQKHL